MSLLGNRYYDETVTDVAPLLPSNDPTGNLLSMSTPLLPPKPPVEQTLLDKKEREYEGVDEKRKRLKIQESDLKMEIVEHEEDVHVQEMEKNIVFDILLGTLRVLFVQLNNNDCTSDTLNDIITTLENITDSVFNTDYETTEIGSDQMFMFVNQHKIVNILSSAQMQLLSIDPNNVTCEDISLVGTTLMEKLTAIREGNPIQEESYIDYAVVTPVFLKANIDFVLENRASQDCRNLYAEYAKIRTDEKKPTFSQLAPTLLENTYSEDKGVNKQCKEFIKFFAKCEYDTIINKNLYSRNLKEVINTYLNEFMSVLCKQLCLDKRLDKFVILNECNRLANGKGMPAARATKIETELKKMQLNIQFDSLPKARNYVVSEIKKLLEDVITGVRGNYIPINQAVDYNTKITSFGYFFTHYNDLSYMLYENCECEGTNIPKKQLVLFGSEVSKYHLHNSGQTPTFELQKTMSEVPGKVSQQVYKSLSELIEDQRRIRDELRSYKMVFKQQWFEQAIRNIKLKVGQNEDKLQVSLLNAYTSVDVKDKQYVGLCLDVADLIHDIDQRVSINAGSDSITTVAKNIYSSLNQNAPFVIENLQFPSGRAQQHKIREYREQMVNLVVSKYSEQNVLLPNLSNIVLQKTEAYAELYSKLIRFSSKSWIYKESGRRPDLIRLLRYYKSLNNVEQDDFRQQCIDVSGETFESNNFYELIEFAEQMCKPVNERQQEEEKPGWSKPYVDMWCISHFDGGGNDMTGATPSVVIFENVMGIFTYYVISNWRDSSPKTGSIGHLVIITTNAPGLFGMKESNSPIAVLCFKDKVTLNSLISDVNSNFGLSLQYRGKGDDANCKSSLYNGSINEFINNFKMNDLDNFKTNISENSDVIRTMLSVITNNNNNNKTMWFYDVAINTFATNITVGADQVKHVLILLNKTIGDKISGVYLADDIKVVSTIDGLVSQSVLYHCLSGKSDCIQEVWRKGNNGSITKTPGVFETDIGLISEDIIYKIITYWNVFSGFKQFNDVVTTLNTLSQSVGISLNKYNRVTSAVQLVNSNIIIPNPNQQNNADTYEYVTMYLTSAENYIVQQKIFRISELLRIKANELKTFYGLPDLTQLFAFNQIEFAIINQAEVSFNEVCGVCTGGVVGFLLSYSSDSSIVPSSKQYFVTLNEDFVVFTFYVPNNESDELALHKKYNKEIAILDQTAHSSQIKTIELGNRQNKLIVKQIRVQKTLEFLIQMVNKIFDSNIQSENVDTLLNGLQEHIVKIVKEQVDNLEGLANKDKIPFDVLSVKNALSVYLNNLFRKVPSSINIDMYENDIRQDEDVCYSQQTNMSMDVEGGKRASTRGKKVVKKKHTKRDRKRVAHKKQTKKLRRKKHRTVNKRRARK